LYSSANIISVKKSRKMSQLGHVVSMRRVRNAYEILNDKPEWKTPLGRPRYRSEDNIKT
jgi:hypothetical protein